MSSTAQQFLRGKHYHAYETSRTKPPPKNCWRGFRFLARHRRDGNDARLELALGLDVAAHRLLHHHCQPGRLATGWITRPGYRLPGLIARTVAGPGAILAMHLVDPQCRASSYCGRVGGRISRHRTAIGIFKGLAALQDTINRSGNS